MKVFIAAACAALISGAASAACVGTESFKTCTDASGNSYTVSRAGNTTMMNGFNSQTGSSWSQNSLRTGNSTFTYGQDADGNSWNATSNAFGTYGTDSDGNSFYSPNF